MEWSTVIFLSAAMVSLVTFMGILILGVKKSSEFKEQAKIIDKKAKYLDSDSKELWKALKKSETEKEKIFERLQNLEAIVTSEAYEAIQSGEESETIKLHLEEESEELKDSDKAAKLAKRVR
tara:strand:- start:67436 stop:67801 length:366 start_codon:yes stop_codon:yes gene_type:complete